MKAIVAILCVGAVMLAISKMPQRDEADKYEPQCVALPGEVAVMNKDGLCEVHKKLDFASAEKPACPIENGCNF